MPDRLSPLDVSFLYFEEPTTPMHVGSVAVFQEPDTGFDHDRLVRLISNRIAFVPRYRQRIRWVPGRLANPVWVDDEDFDITYHVRRSALPRPGSDAQLAELVARVQSRSLDRSRPLWEMYLVEGLSDNRFAIISKTHHAMVDGMGAVDIGQVILDTSPDPRERPQDTWRPTPEPSWVELVAGAVAETVRRPTAVVDTIRGGLSELTSAAGKVLDAAGGLLAAATSAARAAPESPLNAVIGEHRRYAMLALDLDDHRRIRKAHDAHRQRRRARDRGRRPAGLAAHPRREGGVGHDGARAGAGQRPDRGREPGAPATTSPATWSTSRWARPARSCGCTRSPTGCRRTRTPARRSGADGAGRAGRLRPADAALARRAGRQRPVEAVVQPGGHQRARPAAAALRRRTRGCSRPTRSSRWPRARPSRIGLTSYDGQVFYGLNADRDAMPDVDVLAQCLGDALAELLETVR